MKEKSNRGRKSYYSTRVEPFLDDIIVWRENGDTEATVANRLNIGYATLHEYKQKYPELTKALSHSKQRLIDKLTKTVYQIAFTDTKKTYIKNHRTGKMELEKEEIYPTKTQLDAALIALKKLDPENWGLPEVIKEVDNDTIDSISNLIKTIKDTNGDT